MTASLMVLTWKIHERLLLRGQSADRFNAEEPSLSIDCNNKGFLLSFAEWRDAPREPFPEALLFNKWQSSLPCKITQPPYIGDVDVSPCSPQSMRYVGQMMVPRVLQVAQGSPKGQNLQL